MEMVASFASTLTTMGSRVRWIGHAHAGTGASLAVEGKGESLWCGGDGFSQHKEKDPGARLPPIFTAPATHGAAPIQPWPNIIAC